MSTLYSEDNNTDLVQDYTLSVFSENHSGLLYRVTQIFTRRKINIESLTTSESELKGVHRFTIVVRTTEATARKLTDQLEKLVEVLVAFYHEPKETVYQEIALYKLKTETLVSTNVEKIVRDNNARFLSVDPVFSVIEKTGHKEETQELFEALEPFGVMEFVRSGRVAIIKEKKNLSTYLRELEVLS
jgi:acetolactate synthase-1/3 small subunit